MVELQYAENYYFRFCTLSLSAGKRKTLSYYLIMASSSTNEEVVQAGACSLLSGGVNRESVVVVTQKWGGRLGLPGTAACTGKVSYREHRSEAKPTPQCRAQLQKWRLRHPTNAFFPWCPGSLSWDVSGTGWSPPCLGQEMCTAAPAQLQHVSTAQFLAVGFQPA